MSGIKVKKPKPKKKRQVPVSMGNIGRAITWAYQVGINDAANAIDPGGDKPVVIGKERIQGIVAHGCELALGANPGSLVETVEPEEGRIVTPDGLN